MKSVEEVADTAYRLVRDNQGKRNLTSTDLTIALIEIFGDEITRPLAKQAIKKLVDSGKLVYTYFGGSNLQVPPEEESGG